MSVTLKVTTPRPRRASFCGASRPKIQDCPPSPIQGPTTLQRSIPTGQQLTPPNSRRTSVVNNNKLSPPQLKIAVVDDNCDASSGRNTPSIQIPVSPVGSTPRRGHVRSRSACSFNAQTPSYTQHTESSKRKAASTSTHKSKNSSDAPLGVLNAAPITSTFKVTTNAINSNIMQINTESNFRLEVRILGMNVIEVVAVPLLVEPEVVAPLLSFSPPVSPSTMPILDKDINQTATLGADIANLDIPTLNISLSSPTDTSPTAHELEAPPAPKSAEQHLEVVTDFVEKRQIAEFFYSDPSENAEDASFKEGFLKSISAKAAELIKKLEEDNKNVDVDVDGNESTPTSFIKDVATVANVVKLSLYDHVVLCDDSGSMRFNGYIDPLKTCLNSISKIAIALTSPAPGSDQTDGHGISIRFLNYEKDAHMNNLTCLSDIDRAISEVPFLGGTELGKQLRQKILEPFLVDPIQRKNRRLRKPLLVTIITDGDPCGEPRDELKQAILWCKKFMMDMGYGQWAVGFHVAQVGDSRAAEEFLKELENDEEVKEHVYVSREDGDRTGWVDAKDSTDLRWVNSLLKAIEH